VPALPRSAVGPPRSPLAADRLLPWPRTRWPGWIYAERYLPFPTWPPRRNYQVRTAPARRVTVERGPPAPEDAARSPPAARRHTRPTEARSATPGRRAALLPRAEGYLVRRGCGRRKRPGPLPLPVLSRS